MTINTNVVQYRNDIMAKVKVGINGFGRIGRQVIRREHDFRRSTRVKLDSIARQIKEGLMKELSVIIKADTDGSIQALADGLMKIQNDEVKVQIIHQGVGQITETDVLLAAASDAIIIGFRVRPNVNAKKLAEKEDLDVRFYSVI